MAYFTIRKLRIALPRRESLRPRHVPRDPLFPLADATPHLVLVTARGVPAPDADQVRSTAVASHRTKRALGSPEHVDRHATDSGRRHHRHHCWPSRQPGLTQPNRAPGNQWPIKTKVVLSSDPGAMLASSNRGSLSQP